MPPIIEITKQKQAEMYLIFKEILDKYLKEKDSNKKEEACKMALIMVDKLYKSFSIYENFVVLKKFKNKVLKFCDNNATMTLLYIEIFNYFNYVVTPKDIEDLTKSLDSLKISVALSEIFLDKQNLIENIIKTKFKNYDSRFENFIDINNINDYKNLISTYKTYKKQKHKGQLLNEKTF